MPISATYSFEKERVCWRLRRRLKKGGCRSISSTGTESRTFWWNYELGPVSLCVFRLPPLSPENAFKNLALGLIGIFLINKRLNLFSTKMDLLWNNTFLLLLTRNIVLGCMKNCSGLLFFASGSFVAQSHRFTKWASHWLRLSDRTCLSFANRIGLWAFWNLDVVGSLDWA